MNSRWLIPAVLLLLAAAALLLLLPLVPVLRETRESSLTLARMLAPRQLDDALAVFAARLTADAWPWPPAQAPGEEAWRPCEGAWPCLDSAQAGWVLRPGAALESGIERAALLRCPAKGCFDPDAELELRARSEIGERSIELLGWRAPDLSRLGRAWLEREDSATDPDASERGMGCDLSALVLGHRPPRHDCTSPLAGGDEEWLRRFAVRVPNERLCEPREEPLPALLWIPAGTELSCGEALRFGNERMPVLLVLDLPARIGEGSALELIGAMLLRSPVEPRSALRLEGRLAVRGLLAVEGELDLAGELKIEPDAELLSRLASRTVWRPLGAVKAAEGGGGG